MTIDFDKTYMNSCLEYIYILDNAKIVCTQGSHVRIPLDIREYQRVFKKS